jgi:hypothetical protein
MAGRKCFSCGKTIKKADEYHEVFILCTRTKNGKQIEGAIPWIARVDVCVTCQNFVEPTAIDSQMSWLYDLLRTQVRKEYAQAIDRE